MTFHVLLNGYPGTAQSFSLLGSPISRFLSLLRKGLNILGSYSSVIFELSHSNVSVLKTKLVPTTCSLFAKRSRGLANPLPIVEPHNGNMNVIHSPYIREGNVSQEQSSCAMRVRYHQRPYIRDMMHSALNLQCTIRAQLISATRGRASQPKVLAMATDCSATCQQG